MPGECKRYADFLPLCLPYLLTTSQVSYGDHTAVESESEEDGSSASYDSDEANEEDDAMDIDNDNVSRIESKVREQIGSTPTSMCPPSCLPSRDELTVKKHRREAPPSSAPPVKRKPGRPRKNPAAPTQKRVPKSRTRGRPPGVPIATLPQAGTKSAPVKPSKTFYNKRPNGSTTRNAKLEKVVFLPQEIEEEDNFGLETADVERFIDIDLPPQRVSNAPFLEMLSIIYGHRIPRSLHASMDSSTE